MQPIKRNSPEKQIGGTAETKNVLPRHPLTHTPGDPAGSPAS